MLEAIILTNFINSVERLKSNPILSPLSSPTLKMEFEKKPTGEMPNFIYFRALISDIRPLFYSESSDESNLASVRKILKKYGSMIATNRIQNARIEKFKKSVGFLPGVKIDIPNFSPEEFKSLLLYGEGIHYQKLELLEKWYGFSDEIRIILYWFYLLHIRVDILPILQLYQEESIELQKRHKELKYEQAHFPEQY